jgi:hypothetical protein
MNTVTAYAENITVNCVQYGEYQVIDDAASVGKRYPVVIGHATIVRGFVHYIGDRYTAHKGLTAVIAPTAAEGPNYDETIKRVLREGLENGRDDRR